MDYRYLPGLLSDGAPSFTEPDILAFARERYPFINQYQPHVKVNPTHPNPGGFYAETFKPGETGHGAYPRPSDFPAGVLGVEVYRPGKQFGPDDYAAEFLHGDATANQTRADLMKTFSPRQARILKGEPDYAGGEGLSKRRRMENVTDALMRGYTVGQWPKRAIDNFGLTLNQTLMLDALKGYMTGEAKR